MHRNGALIQLMLPIHTETPTCRDLVRSTPEPRDRSGPNLVVGMADVQRDRTRRRNHIRGSGLRLDASNGRDEPGQVLGFTLDLEDPLRGAGEGIAPPQHRRGAAWPADPMNVIFARL